MKSSINIWIILVPVLTLIIGTLIGYLIGRQEFNLKRALKLAEETKLPKEQPSVLMGTYTQEQPLSNVADTKRPAGLVEPKTPEQVAWEAQQAIDKQARGY